MFKLMVIQENNLNFTLNLCGTKILDYIAFDTLFSKNIWTDRPNHVHPDHTLLIELSDLGLHCFAVQLLLFNTPKASC